MSAPKCGGKTCYPDKKAVRTYINYFTRTSRGRHGRPELLRPYPCPICKLWHVTKRNLGEPR